MRFFCLSDTHGGPPPAKAMSLPHGTIILHAGDFYNEGSPKVHSDWGKIIGGETGNDILMVRGNHDCVETDLLAGHDVTMGFSRVDKTWIVGLGWCGQEYNQLPPEALMTKMVLRLLDACAHTFNEGDQSILVTHYLPTGPHFKNWEGWEFKCINALIEAIRPVAVIAGHRHGLSGKTFYQGDVPLIFPGPKGGWLDVEDGGAKWSK